MKKTILFVVLLLLATTSFSQVTRLRTYECTTATFSEETKKYVWGDTKALDVVVLLTRDLVVIYAQQLLSISIVSSGNHEEIEGNDCVLSYAVDAKGIQCGLQVCVSKDKKYTIFVKYADYIFAYYCTEVVI